MPRFHIVKSFLTLVRKKKRKQNYSVDSSRLTISSLLNEVSVSSDADLNGAETRYFSVEKGLFFNPLVINFLQVATSHQDRTARLCLSNSLSDELWYLVKL